MRSRPLTLNLSLQNPVIAWETQHVSQAITGFCSGLGIWLNQAIASDDDGAHHDGDHVHRDGDAHRGDDAPVQSPT
jgi:hypothetical protein